VDQSSRVFFTLSFAMPAFWLGIILILLLQRARARVSA